jgi:hypothetical protein
MFLFMQSVGLDHRRVQVIAGLQSVSELREEPSHKEISNFDD